MLLAPSFYHAEQLFEIFKSENGTKIISKKSCLYRFQNLETEKLSKCRRYQKDEELHFARIFFSVLLLEKQKAQNLAQNFNNSFISQHLAICFQYCVIIFNFCLLCFREHYGKYQQDCQRNKRASSKLSPILSLPISYTGKRRTEKDVQGKQRPLAV